MNRSIVEKNILKLQKIHTGPIQGSVEWLAMRVPSKNSKRGKIGGSEIAKLLDMDPYGNLKELIECKTGKKKVIVDNIFVHLGNLLEEVSVMVFEKTFNTKIYCKEISILKPGGIEDMIFSPDGVCYLPLINNKITLEPVKDGQKVCPVLIEIKNPWSRTLTKDNNVPSQYIPQIQAGLMAMPSLHGGIFIDTQTKLCSYKQLTEGGYNSVLYTGNSSLKNPNITPLHMGVILCMGEIPNDNSFKSKFCEKQQIGKKKIYDFGSCKYFNVWSILKHIKEKKMKVEYKPLFNSKDEIEEIEKDISKKEITGIISYKVYDITYTKCCRDLKIINKIKEKMEKYSNGEYEIMFNIDEDYIPKSKKRKKNIAQDDKTIDFDYSSDSD